MFKDRVDAARIIVAVPVGGEDSVYLMGNRADDVVVAEVPPGFRAVAQVYERWHDLDDKKTLEYLEETAGGVSQG
jgi:predicted phosphoribosyltransferase